MAPPLIYNTAFPSVRSTETVADAVRRMLDDRVNDLPVVDASGRFVGMFKLERLYETLLPRAALIGFGMPDLTFVSDTLAQLREKMREIEHRAVSEYAVPPEHVVHPDTPPLELVLLLHQGVNNIPVVEEGDGRLVGMASARDLLTALRGNGS